MAELTFSLAGDVVVTVSITETLNGSLQFDLDVTGEFPPLIQRIVITYKEEEGQPQFRAQFLEWDMEPDDIEKKLNFTPPEGAEKVRFHVSEPATETGDAS